MNETFDPFVEEPRGARGGNLNNPAQLPERRQRPLNASTLPDGSLGLHRFYREDAAQTGLKNELPWHRMAAYMRNAGRTPVEIGLAAQRGRKEVETLCAQKWFQELCATIANTNGEEIMGALRSYTLESIEGIHEIATNEDFDEDGKPIVNARTKLQAWITLLEQSHGKPVQKVISDISHRVAASPTEEMETIQQELAALRAKPVTLLNPV